MYVAILEVGSYDILALGTTRGEGVGLALAEFQDFAPYADPRSADDVRVYEVEVGTAVSV